MKLTFTGTFKINYQKEKTRIMKAFDYDKSVRDRQLHLLELFKQGKMKDWEDAYYELPYNQSDECPEQEYVGMIFHDIKDSLRFAKFKTSNFKLVK